MARTRRAVGVTLGVLLVAGCGSTPPATPASGTAIASATPATVATASSAATTGSRHVVAGPVELDAPAGWHVRAVLPNPSGNVTFAFLSPGSIPEECVATDQGGVCHPWPVSRSVPGGIVVAVRLYGMPGSRPPLGGEAITVAGLAARRRSGPADEACRAIGGSELLDVVLPTVPGASGWVAIDACIAAGDVAATEAPFDSIVDSVTIVVGPSSR